MGKYVRKWARKYAKRTKKQYYANRNSIYGTKAVFMPKQLAAERAGQVSTKTFYFKTSGQIFSDNNGTVNTSWRTQFGPVQPGNPNRLPDISDSYTFAECYTEYKILAIKVKLFASAVGGETGSLPSGPQQPLQGGFTRGNTVLYFDQDIREGEPLPTNIQDVMTLGSAKMIPSRSERWSVTLYRKKDVPEWGCCDRNVPVANRNPDPWYGGIFILGNNARPLNPAPRLWYFTVTYKIIFRGRTYTP